MIDIPNDFDTLERLFADLGVPTSDIAFYNHPNFMAAEAENPSVLELYAAYVRLRPRDAAYDKHVRQTVPVVSQTLAEEILSDGQLGACVDASQMVNKILEELGIWSYSILGSLTIADPSLSNPTHFWMFDEKPLAGHVWVVAPPFEIIDVTLKAQPYERGEADLMPDVLTIESSKRIIPNSVDFFETGLLAIAHRTVGGTKETVHQRTHPGMMSAVDFFPSWLVKLNKTRMRYATGGISLSTAPDLEAITNRKWNGRYAAAVLRDVVRPALNAERTKDS